MDSTTTAQHDYHVRVGVPVSEVQVERAVHVDEVDFRDLFHVYKQTGWWQARATTKKHFHVRVRTRKSPNLLQINRPKDLGFLGVAKVVQVAIVALTNIQFQRWWARRCTVSLPSR